MTRLPVTVESGCQGKLVYGDGGWHLGTRSRHDDSMIMARWLRLGHLVAVWIQRSVKSSSMA